MQVDMTLHLNIFALNMHASVRCLHTVFVHLCMCQERANTVPALSLDYEAFQQVSGGFMSKILTGENPQQPITLSLGQKFACVRVFLSFERYYRRIHIQRE